MIIDMHAHLINSKHLTDKELLAKDKRDLIKNMERYGVNQSFVSCLVKAQPNPEEISDANKMTYDFTLEYPNRIKGYAVISPEHSNALDVLKRGVEEYGFVGGKIWISAFCNDSSMYALAPQFIEYNIPVLIHSFYKANGQLPFESTGVHVADLAREFPDLKIIMAHLGGDCYHGVSAVRPYRNVWVDFSGTIFGADDLPYTIEQLGVSRILFGSDAPIAFSVPFGQVWDASLTAEQREDILYNNTVRLFDAKNYIGGSL